ncbi:MAG: tRNA (guanosine(46)-N7)-methyltransferase TrmB [Geminicoccaceae bacterium]
MNTEAPPRVLYGRRQGPKLRPGSRLLLQERLPELEVQVTPGLDPRAMFEPVPSAIWLEIGFGGGEHLAARAAEHPQVGFLGVEPFINGVAKLLRAVDDHALLNVRVLRDDARLLLKALPTASVERAFVLYPDPWPKVRHHKRRIVNADTAADLARVVQSGGELLLATDVPDYARWMLAIMLAQPGFAWLAERAADWREPPDGWPGTRYENKAVAAGRRPTYLRFARV